MVCLVKRAGAGVDCRISERGCRFGKPRRQLFKKENELTEPGEYEKIEESVEKTLPGKMNPYDALDVGS